MIPLRDSVGRRRLPLVTVALIVANVIAYLLSIEHGGSIVDGPPSTTIVAYGAIPYELTHLASHCALAAAGFSQSVLCTGQAGVIGSPPSQPPTWATIFTSMFVHADLLHIFIDMFFLGVFGATLEDTLGRLRFLVFYLLGGVAALAMTVAVNPGSTAPSIGAAGAIAAVIAGYLLLAPGARVQTLVALPSLFALPRLPAWTLLAVWLAVALALGALHKITAPGGGAGTVFDAQLGGLAFGLLAVRAFEAARPARGDPAEA